jgi:probable rRNA maturation factor
VSLRFANINKIAFLRITPVFSITIINQQTLLPVDRRAVRGAVRAAVRAEAGWADSARASAIRADKAPAGQGRAKARQTRQKRQTGHVNVVIVDDATISQLHERFLHDSSPTDVLSFPLADRPGIIEGEIIVSAQQALDRAAEFGWQPHDELLLYVVHGTLHLLGHEDQTPAGRANMRRREQAVLASLGIRYG